MSVDPFQFAAKLAALFAPLPQVNAVALGGSRGTGPGTHDDDSDIDLYVYINAPIPPQTRRQIITTCGGAARADLDLNYWGSGDLWIQQPDGIEVDCMYFESTWMQQQITHVMQQHQPAMGYTTCFAYTVAHSHIFHDPLGWFTSLQALCRSPYPEELRRRIILHNSPLLRGIITSYSDQIGKAVKRGDVVSINHRTAALLASYFDILFAFNRLLHPGEKRLIEFARNHCTALPEDMENDLNAVLLLSPADIKSLPVNLTSLLDHLDALLQSGGFSPQQLNGGHR